MKYPSEVSSEVPSEIYAGEVGCISEVLYACNCGVRLVFLCRNCLPNHVLQPGNHMVIPLEMARKNYLSEDDFSTIVYLKDQKLRQKSTNYINKLEDFKFRILTSLQEVEEELEEATNCNLAHIDEAIDRAEYVLRAYEQKIADPTKIDPNIFTEFKLKSKSLKSNVDRYASELDCIDYKVNKAFNKMITIRLKSDEEVKLKNPGIVDSSSSIFFPMSGTKHLREFDSEEYRGTTYDLSNHITHNFHDSSSCILPDGNILIAGGHSGDTYKIDVSKNPVQTTKLGNLNTPRYGAKLIYYEAYIYIFGGYNSTSINKAERMQFYGSNWTTLPDMIEARSVMGVCVEGSRIYIIGGLGNISIEYYDIHLNTFTLLPNIQVPNCGVVAGVIEDRLYVIGKDHLSVFSKDFQLIKSVGYTNICAPFSFSNIIVQGTKLLYLNYQDSSLYMLDSTTKIMTIL